jgi:DNA-binding NarL/FixJ family response regulator
MPAAPAPPPGFAPDAAPDPRPVGRPLQCYLVEDSLVIRQNLAATLEEMLGADVIGAAEDEAGAVRWMQDSPQTCDLMIIDIFLRAGSGLGVLAAARRLRPAMRRVVLTNYATDDMRRRCLELGAERVFDKSAELEELLAFGASLQAGERH